jgi:hypothetical protein
MIIGINSLSLRTGKSLGLPAIAGVQSPQRKDFIMKNFAKFFGIIALAALIGFTAVGCGEIEEKISGTDPTYWATTMELSGTVYEAEENDGSFSYTKYTSNTALEFNANGGSGRITKNGKLKFSIGAPTSTSTIDLEDIELLDDYDLEPSKITNAFILSSISISGYTNGLAKATKSSLSEDTVVYVYVKTDTTIEGEGSRGALGFTLDLKAGWNAVYIKKSTVAGTTTTTVSQKNPSNVKWVLY